MKVEELDISYRIFNQLSRAQIVDVEELHRMSISDVLRIPNIGVKSLIEIQDALNKEGYSMIDRCHFVETRRRQLKMS